MSRDVNPKIAWPIIFLFFISGVTLIVFREPALDWLFFARYNPEPIIERLADDAGMSEEGERLFQRANPLIVGQARIGEECGDIYNLGCIVSGPQIFILEFEPDSLEYEQAVVTAAHEMLHVVYFRMDDQDRLEIDNLIDEEIQELKDKAVLERILSYPADQQLDEAHSIIATEVEDIDPELEDYYDQFFDNREETVEAFQQSRSLID